MNTEDRDDINESEDENIEETQDIAKEIEDTEAPIEN